MATSQHVLSFYSKLDDDTSLSVDINKIDAYKDLVIKDLDNMIKAMKNIQTEYNTIIKKGTVKGAYKDVVQTALKKVNTYVSELETRKKYVKIKMENAKDQYMAKMLVELQKTVEELKANAQN